MKKKKLSARILVFVPLTISLFFPFPARVQVEFYVNENTFKERLKLFFIKNQRSSEWMVQASASQPWLGICVIEMVH